MLRLCSGGSGVRSDESGSGTAIGVAIVFPLLLLVIMVLQGITFATRTEQALQATADRAAHTASLCCLHVGDAGAAAQRSITAHIGSAPWHRLDCTNEVATDTAVEFRSVTNAVVPDTDLSGNPNIVPAGGRVEVFVSCRLPPSRVGVFSLFATDVRRSAIGVATLDPGRHRSMTVTP
ncbi:hypothetical protein [Candidatus Poriferisodalis sp.]|uniref:hypothetical protein n=1 Tax=Candidatus Poriferisodalis sp. TaxID=3101277 RepID=UPI003B0266D2